MSMVAYKASMFMVMFNFAMSVANYIGSIVFSGDTGIGLSEKYIPLLSSVDAFKGDPTANTLALLALTAGTMALFAFSLLAPTIPIIFMFFGLSTILTESYIWQLGLPLVFTLPISMGVIIVYYMGMSQYAARSSFQGS